MTGLWCWLLSPCWLGHAPDLLYDRTPKGESIWRCPRCHQAVQRIVGHPGTRYQVRRPVVRAVRERVVIQAKGRFQ